MKNIHKFFFLLIILTIGIPLVKAENVVNIYLFHSNTCPHCQNEIAALNELELEYDNIRIFKYEVSDTNNMILFYTIANLYNTTISGVPFTVIGDEYIVGFSSENGKNRLITAIEYYSNNAYTDRVGNYLNNTSSSSTTNNTNEKSNNNNLSKITVNGKTISNFSSNKLTYEIAETTEESLTIDATSEDKKASINGTGKKILKLGNNSFDIVVTAENGDKKTYTIKINRQKKLSTDNYLKELSVENHEIYPSFDKDTLEYNLDVDNDVENLIITASANDPNASIQIENPQELNIGINKITIEVTSEDGNQKIYTITVNRSENNKEVVTPNEKIPKNKTINTKIIIITVVATLVISAICYIVYTKLKPHKILNNNLFTDNSDIFPKG